MHQHIKTKQNNKQCINKEQHKLKQQKHHDITNNKKQGIKQNRNTKYKQDFDNTRKAITNNTNKNMHYVTTKHHPTTKKGKASHPNKQGIDKKNHQNITSATTTK